MRFAAALGTIDEVDLLPSVIEQLRRIGFSEIFVLDYGSTDGTLEYLREEERRGDIWVLHPRPTDDYWTWDTIQWRITSDPEIDYVLFLDSDELLLPAGGTLESMDLEGYDVVTIPRYNVVLQPTGPAVPLDDPSRSLSDTLVWARPMSDPFRRLRDDPDMPWIRGQLEPKVLARPSAIRGIQPGFHGIVTDPRARVRSAYAADAIIAHVPIRTFERFERKVANYRATVEAFPEWYEGGQGWQWVRWLRVFDEGRIRQEYELQTTAPSALAELRESGEIRSVGEILERLIPPLPSEAAFDEAARRAQPWLSAAASALAREGFDADLRLRLAPLGQHPSVVLPPGHVVKLCGPWRDGHWIFERERRAHGILARDPGLPIPRLLAQGALDDEWRYLIRTYAPGVALIEVWEEMSPDDRVELAGWLGRFVRRLHDLPLSDAEQETARDAFRAFIGDRLARTAGELAATGTLPAALQAELPAWLPTLDELLPDGFPVAPLHTDLHYENVLLSRVDGRFFGKSVIDLDGLTIGHPLYEIGPAWLWICFGDPDLTAAFLEAARLPGLDGPDMPRVALAWSLLHAGVAVSGIDLPDLGDVATLDDLADRAYERRPALAETVGDAA